jgi:tripartite-type tricarboxylate transporter receptor subunit TctC
MHRRLLLRLASTLFGAVALVSSAFAQTFPSKVVNVVVPYPYKGVGPLITDLVGGTVDIAFLPLAGPVPGMIKEGRRARWASPPPSRTRCSPT